MLPFAISRFLARCVLPTVLLAWVPLTPPASAQDAAGGTPDTSLDSSPSYDPNETSLGDVARSLRRKTAGSQPVIDDDNFSQVMHEAESKRSSGSALKFLMAGDAKGFQVSAPDVTCSLAFNASAKSLLSSQYAQMELPAAEVLKLAGPATIEGDALTVSVFNGTDWHVSEVAVAFTLVKKNQSQPAESEVRPEKKPDQTVVYRMRAASPPSSTTTFSAPLNLDIDPEQEWHWAILQARGYPPQNYAPAGPQATGQMGEPVSTRLPLTPALLAPQDLPTNSPPLSPQ